MLDAVTPLLRIDIQQKMAKNTKIGPPGVVGNVISGVGVRAIPIKVHLSNIPNNALQ